MAYKITGRIVNLGEKTTLTSQSNGNIYLKRDVVIAVRKFDPNTGYPTDDPTDTPKFTFLEQKAIGLESFNIGDLVTIAFNVTGRAFTNREGRQDWFTDVRPISIQKVVIPGAITSGDAPYMPGIVPYPSSSTAASTPTPEQSSSPTAQPATESQSKQTPSVDDLPF